MNTSIKIRNRKIGGGAPCYIIAEMSANHSGSIDHALEIIKEAKAAGADCIKIQTYTADTLTIDSERDYFQIKEGTWKGENLYKLYQKAFTPWEWQPELKAYAEKKGLHFLSTAYDFTSVDFLEKMGVDFYKISSFEANDIPLIRYASFKHKPIILSVGMASLGEIEAAIAAIKATGNDDLCILKCSSAYPAIPEEMNMRTLHNMRETFGVPVGLSDHTLGSLSAIIAVSFGACIIEKHFCISRSRNSPDSSFSMEPEEFKQMVHDIRDAERALGKVTYELSSRELHSKLFRKSIFVVKDIKAGEAFTPDNVRVIRPAAGLPPSHINDVIGKRAKKDIEKGTPFNWDLIG